MKNAFKIGLSLLGILFSLGVGASTNQFQAFDVWPSVGDRYFLTLDSSEGLYQKQYSFSLSNQYLFKSLNVLNPSRTTVTTAVESAFVHFFSAGVGVTDNVQLALTLPVVSLEKFADPTITPLPSKKTTSAIGDIKLSSKIELINHYRHRFGFALQPEVTIPIKGYEKFAGEKGVTGSLKFLTDYLISKKVRAAANIGFQYFSQRVLFNNIDYQERFLWGLGLSGNPRKDLCLSGEVVGTSSLNHFANKDTSPVELVAGAQWSVKDTGFKVGAGGGACLVCSTRAAKARGFVNVAYTQPGSSYRLKDKENLRTVEVTLGLPPENLEESIVMLKGKCPLTAQEFDPRRDDPDCAMFFELKESVVELTQNLSPEKFGEVMLGLQKNCPEDATKFDPEKHDPDCLKLFDLKEKFVTLTGSNANASFSEVMLVIKQNCPQTRREFDPATHDPACLKYFDLKQDILPLLAKSDKDKRALEILLHSQDTDHDGLPDILDECPLDPEDSNGIADGDGCPESGVIVVKGEVRTIAPVHFEFNKTILTLESKEILNHVSDTLIRHPEIKRLEVVGHADPIGSPQANEKISKQRAEVVVKYLKIRGIPDDLSLVPLGVGTQYPIASNDTEEGRQQNRRVEFHFAE